MLALHFTTPAIINSMVLVLWPLQPWGVTGPFATSVSKGAAAPGGCHGCDFLRKGCRKQVVTWAFLNSEDLLHPFTGKYILFLSSFHDPTSVPQNNVSGRQWSAPWNLPPRRFWCSPAAGASPVEPQRVSPAPCSRMGCHSLEPRMSVDGQDYADEAVWFRTPNNQNIQKDPERSRKIQKDPERSRKIQNHTWLKHVVSGWW